MSKYKEGDFGYWWTITEGKPDIEGQIHNDHINCYNRNLTSLKGSPKEVNGNFYCSFNELTSLKYSPKIINGGFYCSNNDLTSLKYCPKIMNGEFYCYNNKIKDKNEFKKIKFCKKISSDFDDNEIMNLIKENSPEYSI